MRASSAEAHEQPTPPFYHWLRNIVPDLASLPPSFAAPCVPALHTSGKSSSSLARFSVTALRTTFVVWEKVFGGGGVGIEEGGRVDGRVRMQTCSHADARRTRRDETRRATTIRLPVSSALFCSALLVLTMGGVKVTKNEGMNPSCHCGLQFSMQYQHQHTYSYISAVCHGRILGEEMTALLRLAVLQSYNFCSVHFSSCCLLGGWLYLCLPIGTARQRDVSGEGSRSGVHSASTSPAHLSPSPSPCRPVALSPSPSPQPLLPASFLFLAGAPSRKGVGERRRPYLIRA